MNLDLRKVLTLDQWHQLKSIREKRGFGGDNIFYRRVAPGPQGKAEPGMPGEMFTMPAPPLLLPNPDSTPCPNRAINLLRGRAKLERAGVSRILIAAAVSMVLPGGAAR